MKFTVKDLLKNKYVLYLTVALAVSQVLGHVAMHDFESIIVFAAVAMVVTYYTKNMILVLGVAMGVTSIVTAGRIAREAFYPSREGMDHGSDEESAEESTEETSEESNEDKCSGKKQDECSEECEWDNSESKCNPIQGFRTNNVPSSSPASVSGGEETEEETEKRIDYAATLESAYDNLHNMLGDGGMKHLTKDTKSLIEQQKQLMNTLKDIAPVMNDAQKTLSTFDLGQLTESMHSIKGMMGSK